MDIDKLPGHDFEDLVEDLIIKLGFVTESRKKSADGGIDIKAICEKPILKGLYIIQCKRYEKPISEQIIRDLYGVITAERANKGILITNSIFTKAAENFAKNKPLELIDGVKLTRLLEEHLSKKFEKECISQDDGGKYRLAYEFLEKDKIRISKRRVAIFEKRVLLDFKKYNSEKAYFSFIEKKSSKIGIFINLVSNQIRDIVNVLNKFSEDNINFSTTQELKKACQELIKTINFVEREQEEIFEIIPPENEQLKNMHNEFKKMHNVFIIVFFKFFDQIELLITKKEVSGLIKTDENGKKRVQFDLTFEAMDLNNMVTEAEKYLKVLGVN